MKTYFILIILIEKITININEYEKTAEYNYKDNLYWVSYNGEINEENFISDNVFILAVIN